MLSGAAQIIAAQIIAAQIIKVRRNTLFRAAIPEVDRFSLKLSPAGGVRDLAVHGNQLLILSGSEDDDIGEAAIHLWDGVSNQARKLCDIPDPKPQSDDKPEARLVFDGTETGLRVLVLSDGPTGGNPREFVIDLR